MDINDRISDAELSTKLLGERYSVFNTIHKSVLLGVHEVTDMSRWKLQEDETSVTFPHISGAMSQGIFGNLTKVSFQVRHGGVGNLYFLCDFSLPNDTCNLVRQIP